MDSGSVRFNQDTVYSVEYLGNGKYKSVVKLVERNPWKDCLYIPGIPVKTKELKQIIHRQ